MLGLLSFHGRTTRLNYLGQGFLQLVLLLALVVGAVAFGAAKAQAGHPGQGLVVGVGVFLIGMVLIGWMGLATTVRRLRDMGWPVAWGMGGLFLVNLLGRLALMPLTKGVAEAATSPAAVTLSLLLSLSASLILLLWPSARRANFDDIEAVFGGEAVDGPAPAADWAGLKANQEARKPAPAAAPAPQRAPIRAPTGEILPRATFGLRQGY